MTLPNKLTVSRFFFTALFVIALLLPAESALREQFPYGKTIALLIFILASLTDWLDGWLARSRRLETTFGALMDPLADKVLVAAAFVCFVELQDFQGIALVRAWMVLIIISREFLVTGLRLVAREQGVVLQASWLGKHKTISQMVTIILVLIGLAAREDWNCLGIDCIQFKVTFSHLVYGCMLITVALTVWSGATYFYVNRKLFLQHA